VAHLLDGQPTDGLNGAHDAMIGIPKIEMEFAHVFRERDGLKVAPRAWAKRIRGSRGVVDEEERKASIVWFHVPVRV
jgi:hypothetical protein